MELPSDATLMFRRLCTSLEKNRVSFTKNEDSHSISFTLHYNEHSEKNVRCGFSISNTGNFIYGSFVPEQAFVWKSTYENALLISAMNTELDIGCYDYDITTGQVRYRFANHLNFSMDNRQFKWIYETCLQNISILCEVLKQAEKDELDL